jgi:hypothetical protein
MDSDDRDLPGPEASRIDMTHHATHAMGSRQMGFSQELFNDSVDADPGVEAEMYEAMADSNPSIYELFLTVITHEKLPSSARGGWISSSSSSRWI